MSFSFKTSEYGVRLPEIYRISNLEQVRNNGRVDMFVRRRNYGQRTTNGGKVLGTYIYVLVGNRGEKMPHVNMEDERWKILSFVRNGTGSVGCGVYDPSQVGGADGIIPDFITPDVLSPPLESGGFLLRVQKYISNQKDNDGQILSNFSEDVRELVWEQICSGIRPMYFMVVEKIASSYAGLTDLFVVPNGGASVCAQAVRNSVLSNRWYSSGSRVWTTKLSGKVLRVVVDLGQRLVNSQYRPDLRVVWVTTNDGALYALNYWNGGVLARRGVSKSNVPVQAIAVNPEDGSVWYAIPDGKGSVLVHGATLNRTSGTISIFTVKSISSPNSRYTKLYSMIPFDKNAAWVSKRIMGGKVSSGSDGKPWFTFIVNKEATISVRMSSPYTFCWADRSHFGAWHGANFSWGPWEYKYSNNTGKTKTSYKKDAEYGVQANVSNVNGICAGVLGAVFVNGHPYYHYDDRSAVERKYTGYRLDKNSPCGRVFGGKSVYYPSYVMDPETGTYKMSGKNPVVVKKRINKLGYPVNGFHVDFINDYTQLGWKVLEEVLGDGVKNVTACGRHCRFGNPKQKGTKVKEDVAAKKFSDDGPDKVASLVSSNTTWLTITDHMSTGTEYLYSDKGSCWWQLQDLGIIYGANASLSNTSGSTYASGANANCPYATSFYFSTGVCEDNPWQVSGCGLPNTRTKLWYDHGRKGKNKEIDTKAVSKTVKEIGNDISGFSYQKNGGGGDYFQAIVPDGSDSSLKGRPYSDTYGWAGWVSKSDDKFLYGSSEDWGINKAGYTWKKERGDMVAYAKAGKPAAPRLSMRGMEMTIPISGALMDTDIGDEANSTTSKILQTDYDGGVVYALSHPKYAAGSVGNVKLKRQLSALESKSSSECDNITIDDANRIYVGGHNGIAVYCSASSPSCCKYDNEYNELQFTSLGNHNNHGSRWNEAVLMRTRGDLGRYTYVDVITSSDTAPNYVTGGNAFGKIDMYLQQANFAHFAGEGGWGRMNCDQTGMDGVKTLGYCFTTKTAAHPNVVAPSGRLLIVEPPTVSGMGACDVSGGYWQKSVLEPTLMDEIRPYGGPPGRYTSADVWNHVSRVVYTDMVEDRMERSSAFGTSAAAYQPAYTKHLLDVYPSGSMVVTDGTLKFFDKGEQNRGNVMTETDVVVPLHPVADGYSSVFVSDVPWNGVTVFGKPISTTNNGRYREGQLTPSGNVGGIYPSVHPERTSRRGGSVYATYNENASGFVSPNRVEFWVRLGGDVYADEVRAELTDVMFGVNYIHLYERWSTPGFCPYVSDPESGKNLFGEC